MSFILKIYFMGMIVFLPNEDGSEVTVLLQDVRQERTASDGSPIDGHLPMLVARSGNCSGDCRDGFDDAAVHFFQGAEGVARGQEASALQDVIDQGAALVLDSSELEIHTAGLTSAGLGTGGVPPGLKLLRALSQQDLRGGSFLPKTERDLQDFGWIASIHDVAPHLGGIDPQLLDPDPGNGRVVGRLRLDQGEIKTRSLVHYGGEIVSLSFRPLGEPSRAGAPASPLAETAVAEIEISGCEVYFQERKFSGKPGRIIRLAPASCTGKEVVEVALLNLPPRGAHDHGVAGHGSPVGTHFELFYQLASNASTAGERPVPYVAEEGGTVPSIARTPTGQEIPDLLERLGLGPIRGGYSSAICPLSQYP